MDIPPLKAVQQMPKAYRAFVTREKLFYRVYFSLVFQSNKDLASQFGLLIKDLVLGLFLIEKRRNWFKPQVVHAKEMFRASGKEDSS